MNEDIAALLGIDHSQLTDLRPIVSRNMQQSSIGDLPTHLCVERRLIENDIHFAGLFARQNCFDNRFRLEKIVSKEFGWLNFEFGFFDTDLFFLLCFASTLALQLHQLLESRNIDRESPLARHQLRQIQRETIRVVKSEGEFTRNEFWQSFLMDGNLLR